ncbi:initiation-specific alpha-1,6-mannosyltransferase [Podospora conica]|nr:initiation-specific alpha-1,6-mannosyltransferase [Schizothecium conicum]
MGFVYSPVRSRAGRVILVTFLALVTIKLFVLQHLLPTPIPPSGPRPPASEIPIPRQIWQIFFAPPEARALNKKFIFTSDWIAAAPGYSYALVEAQAASDFVDTSFPARPEIAATFHALRNPAVKSDFLRYLLLLERGGLYTDLDTQPLTPPEDWLPPHRRAAAHLILGLESDLAIDHGPNFPKEPVQFSQWTIAAAPHHPLLERMVNRTMDALREIATRQGVEIGDIVYTDKEVLDVSGPHGWSEAVIGYLKEVDPSIKDLGDFYGTEGPRYVKDTVVLPVESFRADYLCGWGLKWRLDATRRCLVRHWFTGAWRTNT